MALDKNVFIAVEGIDGSGKSTITQYLSRELRNVHIYACPPMKLLMLKGMMNKASPERRHQYFDFGNYIAGVEIGHSLAFNHVVCNWYAFSTAAFHSVLLEKKLEVPEDILQPDFIVHTNADMRVIEQRLSEREDTTQFEKMDFLAKVQEEYNRLFFGMENVIGVNTAKSTPHYHVQRIIKEIQHRL